MNTHANYNVKVTYDDGSARTYAVVAVSSTDAQRRVNESLRPTMRQHVRDFEVIKQNSQEPYNNG